MPNPTSPNDPIEIFQLTASESDQFHSSLAFCRSQNSLMDPHGFVTAAAEMSKMLPRRLRETVASFMDPTRRLNALLVRGIPVGTDQKTPTDPMDESVGGLSASSGVAAVLSCCASPYGLRGESADRLVHQILPTIGNRTMQISTSSEVRLELHTENAFSDNRPDCLVLFCIRAGPASTLIAGCDDAVRLLDGRTIEILRSESFMTSVDLSIAGPGVRPFIGPMALLTGEGSTLSIRCDFAETRPLGEKAEQALEKLYRATSSCARPVELAPGDLLLINNNLAVHGRGPFTPSFDGNDRWLLRMFGKVSLDSLIGYDPSKCLAPAL
jgi:L-asparagine oxygenase